CSPRDGRRVDARPSGSDMCGPLLQRSAAPPTASRRTAASIARRCTTRAGSRLSTPTWFTMGSGSRRC
ncbi:MAG: Argininosuccinate synthase, partial [uncultured Thermomicrobiales bacterium]